MKNRKEITFIEVSFYPNFLETVSEDFYFATNEKKHFESFVKKYLPNKFYINVSAHYLNRAKKDEENRFSKKKDLLRYLEKI